MSDEVFRQKIETAPEYAHLLGRHIEHDPKSRAFMLPVAVDRSTWHTKTIRIYDPTPNPNQPVGCCTLCAKAMQMNAAGNRVRGVRLDMNWALDGYVWCTHNDEFEGAWNRDGSGQDTGSSGLAACKTAQHFGVGGVYQFLFAGADAVIQAVMDGHVVNVGTNWYESMFTNRFAEHKSLEIAGAVVGGHEWTVRGYNADLDMIEGRCWWGSYRDFLMKRTGLDRLLIGEQGDAHVQQRIQP